MKKQKRYLYLDRNATKSNFKIVVYWNEYAKTDAPKTTFYSYEKFDTQTQTYDFVYSFRKLYSLIGELLGQYKTIIIYFNSNNPEEEEELLYIKEGKLKIRNKKTAQEVMKLLHEIK